MCCKIFWVRIIPFGLAFMLSFYIVNFAEQWNFANKNLQEINTSQTTKPSEKIVYPKKEFGSGIGEQSSSSQSKEIICFACNDGKFKPADTYKSTKSSEKLNLKTEKVQFISKPRAEYTEVARQNEIQGTVRLRATLSADGEIRNIVPVTSLPSGLANQAAIAARHIKFKPAVRNGKPISKVVVLEYNFNIY